MQGMQERRGVRCVCVCVCVFYSPPPCIYSREPRGEASTTGVGDQWGSATCPGWGGRAHGPGRSVGLPGPPTAPTSSGRLSWVSLSDPHWGWPVFTCLNWVLGLHLVHLSLNRCFDIFCDFMSDQSVLATCILAPKYNLHFLKGKVWFRDFIE